MRAFMGAFFSIADMASDVFIVKQYINEGNVSIAKKLIIMIGANMVCQFLIIFLQTKNLKKDRWKTLARGILASATFIKPGECIPTNVTTRPP
jgi:hypothetical protein